MNLTTYTEFEQGSPLWLQARMGIPTASRMKTVMARGVGNTPESKTRRRYLGDLGAELVTGVPTVTYKNAQMERGNAWEPDALQAYMLQREIEVERVAFVRNHEIHCGASPDGLIGTTGGIEIKTMEQGLMFNFLCAPSLPPEHRVQLQGLMWVTGRQWWDLVVYSPGFDLYVERVQRDDVAIEELQRYVVVFQEELAASVLKVTGETIQTHRKRRADQLTERLDSAMMRVSGTVVDTLQAALDASEEVDRG